MSLTIYEAERIITNFNTINNAPIEFSPVVKVKVGQVQCTGFIISHDGYLITAGHLIVGDPNSEFATVYIGESGIEKVAKICKSYYPTYDLCILKIENYSGPFFTLPSEACIKLGDPIIVYSRIYSKVLIHGNIIGYYDHPFDPYNYSLIAADLPFFPGTSGSPIFNLHGDILGMHTHYIDGVSYTVPSPLIYRLFKIMEKENAN